MDMTIPVGDLAVTVPVYYRVVDSMPDDPPKSVPVMAQTGMGTAFVLLYPMPSEYAMPYEDVQAVIDGVRSSLAGDQGLVQVNNGRTSQRRPYIFSIIKTRIEEQGCSTALRST